MSRKNQTAALELDEEEIDVENAASDADEVTAPHSQGDQEAIAQMNNDAKQSHALLVTMCANLLTSSLAASKLPAPLQERIRADFQARLDADSLFEPKELQARIDADRAMLSELSAGAIVQGPGRVTGMFNSDDQLRAAVDDMFEVERDPQYKNVKAARLSGIRELYFMLTGDRGLRGGYYPDEIQLATSADFPGLVANVLNKRVQKTWDELEAAGYGWFHTIVKEEHFESLNDITGVLTGTVGLLPQVSEQGEYPELLMGDVKETASFVKNGGYFPITLEAIDRDQTRKLRQASDELASAAIRTLSSKIAAVFTTGNGAGPTMADGGALFNATPVATSGGHANLGTTALSATEWYNVRKLMFKQTRLVHSSALDAGPRAGIGPKYCLIPIDLEKTARDAFINPWDVSDNKHAENLLKGQVTPIIVPEWTDANDWAAVADPKLIQSIILGERFGLKPEIFVAGRDNDPAMFMNDESRIKVRIFNAVLVQDYRGLYKENVIG